MPILLKNRGFLLNAEIKSFEIPSNFIFNTEFFETRIGCDVAVCSRKGPLDAESYLKCL